MKQLGEIKMTYSMYFHVMTLTKKAQNKSKNLLSYNLEPNLGSALNLARTSPATSIDT